MLLEYLVLPGTRYKVPGTVPTNDTWYYHLPGARDIGPSLPNLLTGMVLGNTPMYIGP